MSNLSSIGRKSQSLPSEHHHWEGACILQLDYNVVLISGKTAFLSIRSEQGYLNIPLPTPIVPRRGAGCVLLPDFRILVAGGTHFIDRDPITETEMLDLRRSNQGWEPGPALSKPC